MGRKCGVDNEVLHKPYLLFFNLENCIDPKTPISGCPTPQVCVEQCPRESFVYRNGDCSSGNFEQIKTKLICSMDIDRVAIQSCTQIDELVQKEKCARWYLPSQSCKFRLSINITNVSLDFIQICRTANFYKLIFAFVCHVSILPNQ